MIIFSDIILLIIYTFLFLMFVLALQCLGKWCFDYYFFAFQFAKRVLVFPYLSLNYHIRVLWT